MACNEHILVVEDDDDLRESLCLLLEAEGYTPVGVGNGKEALSYLRCCNPLPCLIVLDLMMPVMSGREFRAVQRLDATLKSVPIVVISAMDPRMQREEIHDAAGYVPKPIEIGTLTETVRAHC